MYLYICNNIKCILHNIYNDQLSIKIIFICLASTSSISCLPYNENISKLKNKTKLILFQLAIELITNLIHLQMIHLKNLY